MIILAGVDDVDFAKKLTDLYREGLSDKKIAERLQVEGISIRWAQFCRDYAQTDMSHQRVVRQTTPKAAQSSW
jgi:hypothetical protein